MSGRGVARAGRRAAARAALAPLAVAAWFAALPGTAQSRDAAVAPPASVRTTGAAAAPPTAAAPSGSAAGSTDEGVRAAWARCAATLGTNAAVAPRVRRLGETPESVARILPRVLSGEKTMTATTPWVYERDPAQRPTVGGYTVALDAEARPVAVLRTTDVRTVAFDAVTADDTRYEGEPVRPLAVWRDVHVRFFERVLKPLGLQWTPAMPVTLERFEVVCRP